MGAFALPALCCAHTPAPSAPADGAVFVAWVDGKALGAAPDSPLAAGAYRLVKEPEFLSRAWREFRGQE